MSSQLKVLSALDVAETQWLLGRIYYTREGSPTPGTLPPLMNCAVNGVALIGAIIGQLFFGWLGDKIAKKGIWYNPYSHGCLLSRLRYPFRKSAKAVMTTLCFFRFWLGFGIGGNYPLSATIMSEYANKRTRGAFMAAVFAMQGFGIRSAASFPLLSRPRFIVPTNLINTTLQLLLYLKLTMYGESFECSVLYQLLSLTIGV
ncbi:hypothetical protein K1719_043837 [Acacia pycnantha]|nr:hypothetical protein K1719_043837 [Acacia pycnantha]